MQEKLIADILMTIGLSIGLVTKLYAVWDKDTTWPRRSSLTNVITYPITGILPYILLGLWMSLVISSVKYFLRVAIYIWRAPDNEDWLGRKT
jgi:hypothetical protein